MQHKGFQRTFYRGRELERAFIDIWGEETKGTDLLNIILYKEGEKLTQQEVNNANEVIQWLGTNVGLGFVERALNNGGYEVVRKPRTSSTIPPTPVYITDFEYTVLKVFREDQKMYSLIELKTAAKESGVNTIQKALAKLMEMKDKGLITTLDRQGDTYFELTNVGVTLVEQHELLFKVQGGYSLKPPASTLDL